MKFVILVFSAFVLIKSMSYAVYCIKNKHYAPGVLMIFYVLTAVVLVLVKLNQLR